MGGDLGTLGEHPAFEIELAENRLQEMGFLRGCLDHRYLDPRGESHRNGGEPGSRADVDVGFPNVRNHAQTIQEMLGKVLDQLCAGEVEPAVCFEHELAVPGKSLSCGRRELR